MFLLILNAKDEWILDNTFTFQYVSINTGSPIMVLKNQIHLHSNMFLLIHYAELLAECDKCIFTFQYVSINTIVSLIDSANPSIFTFQYVSINTRLLYVYGCISVIYIPICFY